jgi:phosphoribosylanthranilate isomerase
VPVGACGNEHGIDVATIEEFAEIAIHAAGVVAMMRVDDFLHRLSPSLLDIAHGCESDVGLFKEAAEVVLSAAADADPADNDPLTRRHGPVEPKRR